MQSKRIFNGSGSALWVYVISSIIQQIRITRFGSSYPIYLALPVRMRSKCRLSFLCHSRPQMRRYKDIFNSTLNYVLIRHLRRRLIHGSDNATPHRRFQCPPCAARIVHIDSPPSISIQNITHRGRIALHTCRYSQISFVKHIDEVNLRLFHGRACEVCQFAKAFLVFCVHNTDYSGIFKRIGEFYAQLP